MRGLALRASVILGGLVSFAIFSTKAAPALAAAPTLSVEISQFRTDLVDAAPVFCGESSDSLFKAGVFDAQIELAFVRDVKDFAKFAAECASNNGHRGFSYGVCKDLRQWIVSSPAPEAIVVWNQPSKRLMIKTTAMQRDCASFDVDSLVVGQLQPLALIKDRKPGSGDETIDLNQTTYASVSLTCHPAAKAKQGPELWAFLPFLPSESIPGLASEKELLEWLGKKRAGGGLAALASGGRVLQGVADIAALQRDLHHPREMLLDQKKKLKLKGVVVLGENRATARTFTALAELLWNSPQHRRLLLNPLANAIAINTSPLPDRSEKLLVMILARQ